MADQINSNIWSNAIFLLILGFVIPMVNNAGHIGGFLKWTRHGLYSSRPRRCTNNTHRKMAGYPLFDLHPAQYRNVRLEHVGHRDQQGSISLLWIETFFGT